LDSPISESNSYLIFGQKGKRTSDIIISVNGGSSSADSFCVKSRRSLYRDIGSRSVVFIGDMNKDNHQDLAIGYPTSSTCVVYLGRADENSFSNGFVISGKSLSDGFGWSVARAGDMNHDIYEDIAISAKNVGIVYIIYGKPTELLKSFSVSSLSSSDGFQITAGSSSVFNLGISLSSAGDFNNDGYSDLLMSGLTTSSGFVTYVVLGNSTLKDIRLDSSSKQSFYRITSTVTDFAGVSVAGLGDINNDGYDDIIIGSIPFQRGYGIQRSYVIYGKPGGFNHDLILSEMTFVDGFKIIGGGFLVAGTGDINNDGFADMIVSSYYNWVGKGNSFIMIFPSNMTSFPTLIPSSSPSGLLPTSPLPSSTPSIAPSSSFPTSIPTAFFNSSATGTIKPSIPKTGRPTISPTSRIPTISPSLFPSRLPSIKPSVSLVPSLASPKPTFQPSFKKTRIPTILSTIDTHPSSFPSSHPTVKGMIKEEYQTLYQNDTICNEAYQVPSGKQQVIITCEGDLVLSKASSIKENSKIIYKIIPVTFYQHLVIEKFDLVNDQIDLSLFPQYQSLSSLPYSLPPLTLLLSENQSITLTNLELFSLSSANIIISQPFADASASSARSAVFDLSVIASVSIFGSCFLWLICVSYLDRRKNTKTKEKEEKRKKELVKLEQSEQVDVYSHIPSINAEVIEQQAAIPASKGVLSRLTEFSAVSSQRNSEKENSLKQDRNSVYSSSLQDSSLFDGSFSGFSNFSDGFVNPLEDASESLYYEPSIQQRLPSFVENPVISGADEENSEENGENSDVSSDDDEEDDDDDDDDDDDSLSNISDFSLLDV
jgi:hypothetical protein